MQPKSSPRHRGLRVFGALSILAGALVLVTSPGSTVSAASSVAGTVFQDFNANGEFDATVASGQATDVGLAGLTVSAYDATGAEVGTTTTAADGGYTLSVTSTAGTALRVELTLPTSGPLAALRPSFVGPNNGTTVQFVEAGATDIDVALNVPGEYCQANPSLGVSRLCAGVTNSPTGNPSVFVSGYDSGPYTPAAGFTEIYNDWSSNTAGEGDATGGLLGMAWDPANLRLYNTAYIRRHAELFELDGTARPGALFVTSPQDDGTGGSTEFLVDLEGLLAGDQFSNSTPEQPGYVPTNAARELNRILDGSSDGGADDDGVDSDLVTGQDGVYEEVGQTGIGDIEVDGDGNLYVVSLYTKQLYKVTMPADGSAPTTMAALGNITSGVTCTNGQGRPFGITRWRGSLYLGMTCDGSGDFPANAADYSPTTTLDTNISFTVRRYDLTSGQWSTFFGPQSLAGIEKGEADSESDRWVETARRWNPWTNAYPNPPALVGPYDDDAFFVRPVPMFSDIEFDVDGSMILGFRDRNGDQLATNGSETPIGTATGYPALASGDIYRVCRTGTGYTASDYVFEGGTGCPQTVDAENGEEYYAGDRYWSVHAEISVGMVDQVPGFPDLTLTTFDPYEPQSGAELSSATFYSGGVKYLRNSTGGGTPSFPNAGSGVLYYSREAPNAAGGFLKTNGMSDVEALCDAAPVQIGNRVWIDTDYDGIQDPDEVPVAGVTVRLYAADGTTLLGTAITDEEGRYYFSSNLTEDVAGTGDHFGGGLVVGEAHVVRFDEATDYETGGPLANYSLTLDDQGTKDAIDSDATTVDGFPQISIPSRRAGETDHTFDVGFVLLAPVGFGDYVWIDTDRDGVQDAGEPPLAGVVVNLLDADGEPVLDGSGDPITATTNAAGYYFVDDVLPGRYRAEFVLPAGYVFTVTGSGTSATDSNPDPVTGITPEFTIAAAVSGDTVADTDDGTLAVFVNPTIDAGVIFGSVTVGNFVWFDADNDGVQDPGEDPIVGAVLTITDMNGNPVTDVAGRPVGPQTTDADGRYLFEGLPPGQYKVTITYPAGFGPTRPIEGSERGNDSSSFVAVTRVLAAGESDLSLDFGVIPVVSVGDYVWWDTNRDGRQDSTDIPLAGVVLTITTVDGRPAFNSEGKLVTTTVTDAEGWYTFDNLPFGQYKVTVTPPPDFRPTLAGVGSTDGDSSTGFAISRDLQVGGDRDPTLDFGFVDSSGVLPPTGASSTGWLLGLLMVVVGALLCTTARRRRTC